MGFELGYLFAYRMGGPIGGVLNYWHGDDFETSLRSTEDYADQCKSRSGEVFFFPRSQYVVDNVINFKAILILGRCLTPWFFILIWEIRISESPYHRRRCRIYTQVVLYLSFRVGT